MVICDIADSTVWKLRQLNGVSKTRKKRREGEEGGREGEEEILLASHLEVGCDHIIYFGHENELT